MSAIFSDIQTTINRIDPHQEVCYPDYTPDQQNHSFLGERIKLIKAAECPIIRYEYPFLVNTPGASPEMTLPSIESYAWLH